MNEDPILALWGRVVGPNGQPLPAGLAAYVLRLGFDERDRTRMGDLSERAQTGALTDEERAELEAYCHASAFLSVLHSKARVALRTAPVV
jgi:hypothetical protein